MSYIFPRRILRAGDVMDNVELTEDIAPAADRVSGKLNMHNFDQGIASTVAVDGEAFYSIHHYEKFSPFLWTRPFVPAATPPWGFPDGLSAPDQVLVQNNFEWQAIVDGTGEATQVSLTTGQSVLWINAYVQYVWWGFNPTPGSITTSGSQAFSHENNATSVPCNVQFALRINGNVIRETITGIDDLTYRVSVPIKPTQQIGVGGTVLPGPQDIRGEQVCALGPPCLPIRIGACVPCVPGPQVVELVVRRVPYVTDTGVRQYGSYDKVYLYCRQVNVIELKAFPIDSVGPAEVTAPAFEPEEPLTQTSLYTDRVQPVVAAYNDVQEGSLAKGALMHYHLPSTTLAFGQDTFDGVASVPWLFNSFYPGWLLPARDTVTLTAYAGAQATGWSNVAGLRVNNVSISTGRKILVLGNLQVKNVSGSETAPGDEGTNTEPYVVADIASFALFQLMWQPSTNAATAWTSMEESLGMVNNFVWFTREPFSGSQPGNYLPAWSIENVEVHLMALLDLPPSATSINIGIFGSVANTNDECEVIRGNLSFISLRE